MTTFLSGTNQSGAIGPTETLAFSAHYDVSNEQFVVHAQVPISCSMRSSHFMVSLVGHSASGIPSILEDPILGPKVKEFRNLFASWAKKHIPGKPSLLLLAIL